MRIAALLVILTACTSSAAPPPAPPPEPRSLIRASAADAGVALVEETTPSWSVHFSPKGGCADAAVAFIGSAKETVRLAGYSFTSQPIAAALIAAHQRGVDVQVVLDRENAGAVPAAGTKAPALKAAGVPVYIDSRHAIFHDKFIVVDEKAIETGSFNFTAQAETSNAENCFTYRSAAAAKSFGDNWALHQAHSPPL